ncbi:hypothetical protein PVAND_004195 [Polypedilum vanderplanki]|uniref:Uncharacterized protein n=1 Tax=Polypedilum vanderplanki TaxID=319348 RepID=A0A9J6BWD7_POLVA|nr:hypothetical protein PVAND_004195 [Polypedilum vanderplanki]
MDDYLNVFLNLIEFEKKMSMTQGSPGFKHKSPVLSYSVDIIDFVVRNVENLDYLEKFETIWSAHLHPQSHFITEMIKTFCISSSSDLIVLLYRVCVQLSDLAPNMTLNVTRSIVDMILSEATDKNNEGSPSLSRLLKFLALLVRHPCVKVSVLSILSGGKLAEFYHNY